MFAKNIPGNNCIREKTILVSISFTYYFVKNFQDISTVHDGSAIGR